MSVKVKLIKSTDFLPLVKKQARQLFVDTTKAVVPMIEKDLVTEHEETFKEVSGEYQPAYNKRNQKKEPYISVNNARDKLYRHKRVKITVKKTFTSQLEMIISLDIVVHDERGRPNNLWYWWDQGTKAFVQRERSPFLGANGNAYMKVGDSRPAKQAKKWSETIAKHIIKKYVPVLERESGVQGWEGKFTVKPRKLVHHKISNKV